MTTLNQTLETTNDLGKALEIRSRVEAVAQLPWREQPEALFFIAFDSLPISTQRKLCAAFGGSVAEIVEGRRLRPSEIDWSVPTPRRYAREYWYRAYRADMVGEIDEAPEEYQALRILAESLYQDFAVGMTVKLRALRASEGV